jgi:MFS family permease
MQKLKTVNHGALAWVMILTASLFFFYEFIQLNMPNAINVELMQAFKLDAPGLGWLVSMYFWGNVIFLFPAGSLLDRYSTKKIILTALIFCIFGTFIFALAQDYMVAAAGRLIVGFGAAFCFLGCIRLASRWFPPSRMALVTGLVVTMAMLGGSVAQSPMVFLTKMVGLRQALMIDAALGIVVALIILFVVQDRPANTQDSAQAEKAHLKSLGFARGVKLVVTNRNNWLGGIYTSLLNLPVFLLGGLWGMRYLVQVHGLSELEASYATSILFVGIIFGSPAFGWLSDHIGKRCKPMIWGGILSLIVMLILMYAPSLSFTSIMVLFFLIGFVTSSQVLSYPTIAELNPTALTGTALSIASLTIMSSGMIFDPFFGWLLEWNWDKTVVNNTPIYSLHDFNTAMWIMPIAFIVGIAIAFMIRETNCESQVV